MQTCEMNEKKGIKLHNNKMRKQQQEMNSHLKWAIKHVHIGFSIDSFQTLDSHVSLSILFYFMYFPLSVQMH